MAGSLRSSLKSLDTIFRTARDLVPELAPVQPYIYISQRFATKKQQGSSKNRKGSESKRLGVKLFGGEVCQPGSIIIRQRGTKWHPAENVGLGRDHTIYSLVNGTVVFNKCQQTKRTWVGVESYQLNTAKPNTMEAGNATGNGERGTSLRGTGNATGNASGLDSASRL